MFKCFGGACSVTGAELRGAQIWQTHHIRCIQNPAHALIAERLDL